MCNHKIYSCGIFILNGSLVIQNIFHDESHIEAQESVVKKKCKENKQPRRNDYNK